MDPVLAMLVVLAVAFAAWAFGYRAGAARFSRPHSTDAESAAREFERTLDLEVRRARRYAHPLAVVMLAANGSRFSTGVHEALKQHLREGDSLAQAAPDRFVLLLLECRGAEAMNVAERMRSAATAAVDSRIRFSVGVATYGSATPVTAAQVLQQLERRMGEVKSVDYDGVGLVAVA